MVDDPIVDVENIYRHLRHAAAKRRSQAVLSAVNEVRPPIILATLAVIVSFLPHVLHHRHDGALHAADGPERAAVR